LEKLLAAGRFAGQAKSYGRKLVTA
jgi:hypothetical protein